MKAVYVLCVLFCLFKSIQSQVNLSPNGSTKQSSQFEGYASSLAINGGPTHNWDSKSCSATGAQRAISWWMISFPELVVISDVIIYYRGNNPSRLAGYYLFVTNYTLETTATEPPKCGHLCYHHDDKELPDVLQNVTCDRMGARVIVYNERKSGVTYPPVYSDHALLELCDVQIYGCFKSWWGTNCKKRCPAYCIDQHCHISTGACIWGCRPNNCLSSTCSLEGFCDKGCKPSLAGQVCDEFNVATYASLVGVDTTTTNQQAMFIIDGDKTFSSCVRLSGESPFIEIDLGEPNVVTSIHVTLKGSNNTDNYTIAIAKSKSDDDGTIHSSIDSSATLVIPFYEHIYNMDPLIIGRFTKLKTLFPEDILDICEIEIIGCPPGLQGKLCDKPCPVNCDGACDPRDGKCLFGCKEFYRGRNCNESCETGYYGDQCEKKCPVNCESACRPDSGHCVSGCKESFVGLKCNEGCLPGKYGTFCDKNCPGSCDGQCDRQSGHCLIKCEGSACGEDKSSAVPTVVGVVVTVVVICAIIIGVCIYKRRNSSHQKETCTNDLANTDYTMTLNRSQKRGQNEATLYNDLEISPDVRENQFNGLVMREHGNSLNFPNVQARSNDAFHTEEPIYHEMDSTKVKRAIAKSQTANQTHYEDMSGKC